jgi:Flp pilus assembly pilin Flp
MLLLRGLIKEGQMRLSIISCRRAQSVLEYAMLVMVVSAALMAMSQYIQRSMNARLKQIQVELDESRR